MVYRRQVAAWALSTLCLLGTMLSPAAAADFKPVASFGSNPGSLKMFKRVPDRLDGRAPLVVVMHGCKQNARNYASAADWTNLSDKLRFILIVPEQNSSNNTNNCFNWFQAEDNSRDQGEALSIKQMIDKIKRDHAIDAKRVFITGLSAGGAMASVMLANYPEVFAGGAIVAGVPYGCAHNVIEAFQCMSSAYPSSASPMCLFFPVFPWLCPAGGSSGAFSPAQLGDFVRKASNHTGPFPRVSIWHGSEDTTVNPANAKAEMQQWTNVHGIQSTPSAQDIVKGYPRQIFKDPSGKVAVETYLITGMAHGVPVDPGPATDQCGTTDPYVLDADVCSSLLIAKFWELTTPIK